MSREEWQKRGGRFGEGAKVYDRTRPGYPLDSVRWTLGEKPRTVLDLGAGTGILTRVLLEEGHHVTAAEPDEAMREMIGASSAELSVLPSSAEKIALPDGSVDAVLASHAYHWFDPEPAHAEIARVLRPGGLFAALWNLRDESVPWSAELSRILSDEDAGTDPETPAAIMLHGALGALRDGDPDRLSGWLRHPTFGPRFSAIEQGFFPHSETTTAAALLDLITSRSYYLNSSPERREEIEEQVKRLTDTHPDLAGREEFELPYVTVVFKAVRPA
ncbi:class I SAM-dependent methyltransferase [Actinomadura macrotermitis]|uniref:Putative methyltransferase n=1 Tax=Actinomadura macrotermitis TaxID=2585200 RepID=A0A7K0C046_9ACTN|nr:class I SAM-dependent methyltransferase [Actinomadura macrotermitis]MQY06801.1 putative methyltransferase [Actinomadura macrotermitis]